MKYLKALSLAAVAALALMAFVGASSASAKVCSTAGVGPACAGSHGNEYTGTIDASLIATTGTTEVHAVLTSGFIQVTCTSSTVQGSITNSATGVGNITALTFGGCTNNIGGACTANTSATAGAPWPAKAVTETAPNGRLEVENVTGTFTCSTNFFGNVTCRYKKGKVGAAGEIKVFGSDTTPTIEASEVPLELEQTSSGFCSETAKWDGRYELTTPTSLFLT